MNRRHFILSGIAIGTTLSLGLTGWHYSRLPDKDNRRWLLSVLLPALLYGALPRDSSLAAEQLQRTEQAVLDFMPFLPLSQQQQLDQLFNALAQPLVQLAVSGHVLAADDVSTLQRIDMLNSWRNSYLALLQQAYHGLRELLMGAYYGQPEHWLPLNYNAPVFR